MVTSSSPVTSHDGILHCSHPAGIVKPLPIHLKLRLAEVTAVTSENVSQDSLALSLHTSRTLFVAIGSMLETSPRHRMPHGGSGKTTRRSSSTKRVEDHGWGKTTIPRSLCIPR